MRWYHYVAYFFRGRIPRERPCPISATGSRGTPSRAPLHHRLG
jgi:hypothetical protein